MKECLCVSNLVSLLESTCLDMEAACDELTEIDAKSGDGDLGVSVKLGFEAVRRGLPELAGLDVGTLLMKSGMAFNAAGASTFGTLMATAFMRAGKVAKDKSEIDLADLAEMMKSAVDGIMERGKAVCGERTMLDALVPAQEALTACSDDSKSLGEALAAAAEAASKGAESTAQMKAKHGRAGWIGKRSEGLPDAGATAIAMLLASLSKHYGVSRSESTKNSYPLSEHINENN